MQKRAFVLFVFATLLSAPSWASKTYTNPMHLYSVDYPDAWHVKEMGGIAMFMSPFESKEDRFSENVDIIVEDLRGAGGISLLDYYRKSTSEAPSRLPGFKILEEAKTKFAGRDAIAELYTAMVKGELFRFKVYTLLVGTDAYVLTYKGREEDFEKYLPAAEKLMRSLRVSP